MKKTTIALAVLTLFVSNIFAVGTFDGDEFADVFLATTGGSTYWYESDGTDNGLSYYDSITSADAPNSVAVGHLSGTDIWTLAVGKGNLTGGVVRLYKMDGATMVSAGSAWDVEMTGSYADRATRPNGLTIGNFDSAGVGNLGAVLDTNTLYTGEGTVTGGTAEGVAVYEQWASSYAVTACYTDLDGDGKTGLFVSRNESGHYFTNWYEYDATNDVVWNKNFNDSREAEGGYAVVDIAAGDVDNDGFNDLISLRADGTLFWCEGETIGNVGEVESSIGILNGYAINCVAVGDIDSDGVAELLLGINTGIMIYEYEVDSFVFKNIIEVAGGVQDLAIAVAEASGPILLEGDANRDGVVSAGDYASVQANFGMTGEAGLIGDANGDGVVSAGDYASVQANFGNTAAASVVPEPCTLALLSLGGLALLRKMRR